MKLHHYPETDSLSIDLGLNASTDSREISDGVVMDIDQQGHVVGLDIPNASKRLALSSVETEHLPLLMTA